METNVILNINDIEYVARLTYDFTKGYGAFYDEPGADDEWHLEELVIYSDDDNGNTLANDVSFLLDDKEMQDNLIEQVKEDV